MGLGEYEEDWLKEFDRKWDTKAEGRSSTDAMRFAYCTQAESISQGIGIDLTDTSDRVALEAKIIHFATQISRITVPRMTKSGWSIHVYLRSGRCCRTHFEDESSAGQAYYAFQELSFLFPMT